MLPEIRVGFYFHFSCSCGTTTVTGQSTVRCRGCGKALAVRRVNELARIPGASPYYGVVDSDSPPAPASQVQLSSVEAEHPSAKRPVGILDWVRVGRLKPDGITPHPHAGAMGEVVDIFNGHAHVIVGGRGGGYSICISLACLEAAGARGIGRAAAV